MSKNTYTTRTEAIFAEIIAPLGEFTDNFDIEAIADQAIGDYSEGYAPKLGADEFWAIVADCEVAA